MEKATLQSAGRICAISSPFWVLGTKSTVSATFVVLWISLLPRIQGHPDLWIGLSLCSSA